MDRRQAIKLMATIPVVGVLPNVVQGEENQSLPIIKFHGTDRVCNSDEIFKGAEWKEVYQNYEQRKTLAWLPKDKAMHTAYASMNEYFHGEVLVYQSRHIIDKEPLFHIYISKTKESIVECIAEPRIVCIEN